MVRQSGVPLGRNGSRRTFISSRCTKIIRVAKMFSPLQFILNTEDTFKGCLKMAAEVCSTVDWGQIWLKCQGLGVSEEDSILERPLQVPHAERQSSVVVSDNTTIASGRRGIGFIARTSNARFGRGAILRLGPTESSDSASDEDSSEESVSADADEARCKWQHQKEHTTRIFIRIFFHTILCTLLV